MLMDIYQIRLFNARSILESELPGRGQFKRLAERMNWHQQFGSAIAGKNPSKNIGGKTARLLENEFRKPRDWMDAPHHHDWKAHGFIEEIPESTPIDQISKQELPLIKTTSDINKWVARELNHEQDTVFFPLLPMMKLSPNAYVIEETTNAMPPMKPGDFYYIDPDVKPKSGDWCVFDFDGQPIVGELEKGLRNARLMFHNEIDPPENVILSECLGVVSTKMMGDFLRGQQ